VRTNELHTNIVELSDIRKQKSNASSPYGPVRAGLTTSQTTLDQQLTELLSSLESVVESLNYKSFTVYDTLNIAMENLRVALSNIATEEDGTDTI
jgi:glutathionyl-hydroquinone reductase